MSHVACCYLIPELSFACRRRVPAALPRAHHGGRRLGPTHPLARLRRLRIGIRNSNSVCIGHRVNRQTLQTHSEKGTHQVTPRLSQLQATESQVPRNVARMLQLHPHRPSVPVPRPLPRAAGWVLDFPRVMAGHHLLAIGSTAVDPYPLHPRRHALLPSLPCQCLPASAHPG